MRRLLLLFSALGFLSGLAGAAELIGQIQVDQPSSGAAVVHWQTDVECGGRLRYGLSPKQFASVAEAEITRDHTVRLEGLSAGQRYFLNVGTARKPLGSGTFVVLGSPAQQPPEKSAASSTKTVSPPSRSPVTTFSGNAPPARDTWGNPSSLPDHFARHGADFRASDAEDYARQAWLFLQRAKTAGLPAKRDPDGSLRIFDPATGAFAAYNRNGTTRTYFKPGSPGYFDRQPGTLVDLRTAR